MKFLHTTFKIFIIIASVLAFILFFIFAPAAFAQNPQFTPLVGLPGLENLPATGGIPQYINAVYILIIVVGALIGVAKLALAGVKYSMSDVVTTKEDAKEDIKGVLLGLAILLIPFIVLNTINPDLTRLDVLSRAVRMDLNVSSQPVNNLPGADNQIRQIEDSCGQTASRYTNAQGQTAYCCSRTGYTGQYSCPSNGEFISGTTCTPSNFNPCTTPSQEDTAYCQSRGGTAQMRPEPRPGPGGQTRTVYRLVCSR